ncbi:TPA: hypothetical protein PXR13_004092, partial [Yersinia enterocolitica]|nr:hypothetical protein [Yersinia enterocolitica]
PMQISKKITKLDNVTVDDDIDEALEKIKKFSEEKRISNLLDDFEISLLKNVVYFI